MKGPTSIMHFCGFPSVTVAAPVKTDTGINQTVILYGKDEYRLYEAALAIEQEIYSVFSKKTVDHINNNFG